MTNSDTPLDVIDFEPATESFLDEVLSSLARTDKWLPSKFFYDEEGSRLFEEICDLDEYYLTRTELGIVQSYAAEMAAIIGPQARLVEFGSGSSLKTRILLDHLEDLAAYVPVDISREHLRQTSLDIADSYPGLNIQPVCADFTEPFNLPDGGETGGKTVVYFPGSTIGNLEPSEAKRLLRDVAEIAGPGGGLLIGIDLKKSRAKLEAAYNDREGVTSEFNLNLLRRINRELGADFDVDQFFHRATYNAVAGRMEMFLVSRQTHDVTVAGERFHFEEGESICTEYSHKYTIEGFRELAADAGFELNRCWSDANRWFAVLYLSVKD